MKIKTLVEFSGVPINSTGEAIREGDLWKITWDNLTRFGGIPFKKKPLEDYFDNEEFKKYLVRI